MNQTSEINSQALFDNMLDGLAHCQIIFDEKENPVDFVYLTVNKNFEQLTGLKEVTGKKATQIDPGIKQSSPELFEIYGRVSSTGKAERFEIYSKLPAKWFLVSVYSQKKPYFTAMFQNITDRKQAEKKLEDALIAARNVFQDLNTEKTKLDEAKAKEGAILGSIADGIVSFDKTGRLILMNRTAEKFLGYKNSESMGKKWYEILQEEDEKGVPIPLKQRPIKLALSTTKTTTNFTIYYVRKDGTKFPASCTVAPIILHGTQIGVINVFRDVTQEKEIDRAKSEFVSLASHQLRTPATAVNWFVNMLLKEKVGEINEQQRNYLYHIYTGNKRMINLVKTLLNVTRIDSGDMIISPQAVNLSEVCQNVIEELKPQIIAKKLKMVENYEGTRSLIQADPKLIYIIIQNLLSNAITYSLEGGQVVISISPKRKKNISSFLITITDLGIGIPQSAQARIFTKLFRADNAKETVTDGTGLGLYMVKSILDHSGGSIWFESPGLGHLAERKENTGTTFYVDLPLKAKEQKKGSVSLL